MVLINLLIIVTNRANPVNFLRMHKRSVYHIKFRMKMLFLVCLFETIKANNASNTFSPSFHKVGCFARFLYVHSRAGRFRFLIIFIGRLADSICYFFGRNSKYCSYDRPWVSHKELLKNAMCIFYNDSNPFTLK